MSTQAGGRKRPLPASAEQRLKELDIKLPAPPEAFGTYVEAVQTGNAAGRVWKRQESVPRSTSRVESSSTARAGFPKDVWRARVISIAGAGPKTEYPVKYPTLYRTVLWLGPL